MKALILNSGLGSRMGVLTSEHPKCMTELTHSETIISRQLKQIKEIGITDVIITTGYNESVLRNYIAGLDTDLNIIYVNNPDYKTTNYIYSIYLAREYLHDDILFMHGDLVFENEVLDAVLESERSVMTVSSTRELPEKDFKAVIDSAGKIHKIGVNFFDDAVSAQPLYKLEKSDWEKWLAEIEKHCVKALGGGGGINLLCRGCSE